MPDKTEKLSPVSVSSHLFAYETFSHSLLAKIKQHGFTGVELWGMKPHLNYDDPLAAVKVVEALKTSDLSALTVHGPFYKSIEEARRGRWLSLADPDEDRRKEAVRETRQVIRLAKTVSAGIVVIHMGGDSGAISDLNGMKKSINELLKYTEPLNIALALENIGTDFSRTDRILDLIEGFPKGLVGVCLDIGHANLNEDPFTAVEKVKKRLLSLHLSDNLGKVDQHLVPGKGNIDWRKVADKLSQIGFRGPLVLELRDPEKQYDLSLKTAYNNLYINPGFFDNL